MKDNIQHKLKRVRPPRVKISYDVEIGDAVEKRELPFVGALVADLAGDAAKEQGKLSERKFVEVDNESIDDVMQGINPKLNFVVDDKLSDGGGQLNVALSFSSMSDLSPESVIQQVEPLRRLFEARQRLNDLAAQLDGNDELDSLLSQVIQDTGKRDALSSALETQAGADAPASDPTSGDDAATNDE
jgi:type VI secretion system protein ImpB